MPLLLCLNSEVHIQATAETMPDDDSLASRLKSGAGRALAGGFIVHLALGTMYCWANNTLYVTSSLRQAHHELSYDGKSQPSRLPIWVTWFSFVVFPFFGAPS